MEQQQLDSKTSVSCSLNLINVWKTVSISYPIEMDRQKGHTFPNFALHSTQGTPHSRAFCIASVFVTHLQSHRSLVCRRLIPVVLEINLVSYENVLHSNLFDLQLVPHGLDHFKTVPRIDSEHKDVRVDAHTSFTRYRCLIVLQKRANEDSRRNSAYHSSCVVNQDVKVHLVYLRLCGPNLGWVGIVFEKKLIGLEISGNTCLSY